MTEPPRVSIVVLNYNGRHHLGPCLESIQALDYPPDRIEVIVCDNHSSDGSVDFVRSKFPDVKVVALDANYGFAEGNNRAAHKASFEWLAFLNNDMHVDRCWLRELTAPLGSQPELACVSSKILNWDGTKIDFIGAGISFQGFGWQWDFGATASPRDEPRRLLCPCGGAMLIRKDVFLEVGAFDPDYFGFYEDTDLGWRLNLLGHDVWYTPGAVVYHRHHGTYDRFRYRKVRVLYERNSLFTMYKCLDDANLAAALPATLLLQNEKALRMGGIDTRPFLIGPRADDGADGAADAAPPAPPEPDGGDRARPPLPVRAWRLLRNQGGGAVARRSLEVLGIRRRLAPPPPPDDKVLVPDFMLSFYIAMSDFGHSLEKLNEKRRWLQERRVRSDDELLPLFHFALVPSYDHPDYVHFHEWLCHLLGLDTRFAAGQKLTLKQAGL